MYLLLYLHDIIIAGKILEIFVKVKWDPVNKYELKDKGFLIIFLGLEINYNQFLEI